MNLSNKLLEKGYLIESELAALLEQLDLDFEAIILNLNPPKIVTKNFFLNNLERIQTSLSTSEIKKIYEVFQLKPKKEQLAEVLVEPLPIETKKVKVEDFTNYFRSRLKLLKPFIQDRLEGLSSIDKLPTHKHKVSVIGLVTERKITKNKNISFSIEDSTGLVKAVVLHKKELFDQASQLVEDEVIGISGVGNKEIIFVDQLVWPDLAVKKPKRAVKDLYVAFTSDLHIGSDKFLEQNFLNFIDWLQGKNGTARQQEFAQKLKWLFIVGDTVDGIGVYPGQEEELEIQDIKQQYKKLAQLLSKIPKHINVILCPGGLHDAVRVAEPQPPIPEKLAPNLYELQNLCLVTNPARVKIVQKGFELEVLMYHGDSYDYYTDFVDWLRLNQARLRPELVQHFLLKRRHLAPAHQSTTFFPMSEDPLVIKKAPEIFVSGHMHKSAISYYNNILVISCSCWQAKTPYQEKFGHQPDPCKVPLVNLKTGKTSLLDFS